MREKKTNENALNKAAVYDSIEEMPLYNWKMIHREQDFRYVIVGSRKANIDKLEYDPEEVANGWESCYAEYITDFALDGKLKKVLKLETQIALLTCRKILEGRQGLETKIDVMRKKLLALQTTNEGADVDFDKQIAIIEKWMGIRIDDKETSVRRFYTYLKLYDYEVGS